MVSPAIKQFIIDRIQNLVKNMNKREINHVRISVDNLRLSTNVDQNVEIIKLFIKDVAEFLQKRRNATNYDFSQYVTDVLYDRSDSSNSTIVRPAISVKNLLGYDSQTAIRLAFNPQSCYSTHYIALDSRYKNSSTSNATELSWIYSREIQQPTTGNISSNTPIVNIVAMRLYMVSLPFTFIGLDRAIQNRVMSVIIKEFDTQITAFSGQLKYHFLGRFENQDYGIYGSNRIETDDPQGMTYYFQQPIRYLDSITLSLGTPDQRVEFYPEQFGNVIVQYDPGWIYFYFPDGHNLVTNYDDRCTICVAGFTTNSPNEGDNPTLIQRVNALPGITVFIFDDHYLDFPTNIDPIDPIDELVVSVYLVAQQTITFMEFLCNDQIESDD